MSRSYLRTSAAPAGLLLLAVLATSLCATGHAVAKGKPDPQAAAAAEEESNDPCLLDGLCRAHYLRARNLSRDGNFAGALAAYEAAYRRRSVPWLLISIGRTLHKLGRPAEAIQQYQRYRQEDKNPNPTRLSRVDEYTQQAEADVAAAVKPVPVPTPAPPVANGGDGTPGKTGTGGDSSTGPAPSPDSGTTAPKLPPVSTTIPPSTDPAAAAPVPGAAAPGPASPQPRWKWPGLWIGLGVSGGMLLLGGALGIAAQASSSQLRGMTYVGGSPTSDVVALQDRIRGLAISADVFFAATAVSLGVTLALTLTRKPAVERPVSRALPGLEDLGPPPVASPRGEPVSPSSSGSVPAAPAKAEPVPSPPKAPAASSEPAASAPSPPSASSSSGASPAPGRESAPAEATSATATPGTPAAVPAAPSAAPASPAAPAAAPAAPSAAPAAPSAAPAAPSAAPASPAAPAPSASSPAPGGSPAGDSKPATPASPQTGKSAP